MGSVHALGLALLAAIAAQALLNARRLARLERFPPAREPATVAVLVPARNEAARIAACVRAWRAQDRRDFELVVYDDDSTDGTAALAGAAAGADPRVRVLRGSALPPGWRGKAYACHQLRALTRAEVLVFADADVVPDPRALGHALGALVALGAGACSALVRHWSPSLAVRALTGLQAWAVFAFVPLWLRGRGARPRFTVTNGQFLVLRADACDAVGGFAAVASSLAEDTALGRRLAAAGYRVALVDGAGLLACRPYTRLGEAWQANVRNLAVALLGSGSLAVVAAAGLALLHLGPVAQLGAALAAGDAWLGSVALVEIALGLVPRALADRRARHPAAETLLHPLAVAALVAMIAESALRYRGLGTVEWRGRRYVATDPG
jgi:hypothetical protein